MQIFQINDIQSQIPTNYIDREIKLDIIAKLKNKEVIVLYGARQTGKSVLMMKVIEHLLQNKKQKFDIFHYNLDYIPEEFKTPDSFVNLISTKKKFLKGETYIFIDEAQKYSDIGNFVKYIYDLNIGYKFFLTGSASLDIKKKTKETLVGRKFEFFLPSLQIKEIFKKNSINYANTQESTAEMQQILYDFMLWGGYPGVFTLQSTQEKADKLKEITQTYINRDINELFDLSDSDKIKLVALYIADNLGSLFSIESLTHISNINRVQIEKIVFALENSFLVTKCKPFVKQSSKEVLNMPKIYFNDNGIRNTLINKLNTDFLQLETGKLFENSTFIALNNRNFGNIRFWRTKNQTEIDFVEMLSSQKVNSFEVKYKWTSSKPRNLLAFENEYKQITNQSTVISNTNFHQFL